MKKLVFATHNSHKLDEVAKILEDIIQVVSLTDLHCVEEIPEKGVNLQSNALQKAQFVDERFKSDCFGDDTGLEVEALGGEPGVFSARYAGEQANSEANIDKLLKNLKGVTNRKAQFRTVIALIYRQRVYYFEGIIKGRIIEERQGDHGFGYDSIFTPDGYNQTFAELPSEIKNTISHRAQAIHKLAAFLNDQN